MDEKLTEAISQVPRQTRERFFHLDLQGASIERVAAQLRQLRREILAEVLDERPSGESDIVARGKEAEILDRLQKTILLLDQAKQSAHKIAELLAGDLATQYAEWKRSVEAARQS